MAFLWECSRAPTPKPGWSPHRILFSEGLSGAWGGEWEPQQRGFLGKLRGKSQS